MCSAPPAATRSLLVGGTEPVTLDEVQREPGFLAAVKRSIDRDRTPGRFLLTGSANLLLMHQVSESLAGRASYLTLWPMTRREQRGEGRAGRWDELLAARDDEWLDVLSAANDESGGLAGARPPRRLSHAGAPARDGRRSARSGSTATCAPTSSATYRISPQSAHCPTSGA